MKEVCWFSSNELIKEEKPACQAIMSPFVMFGVDFGKRYQVTCLVAFLGPTFPTLSIERLLELWLV